MPFTPDKADLEILRLLQDNCELTNDAISQKLIAARISSMGEAAVSRRITRLRETGFITGYHAAINRKKIALQEVVLILVQLSSHKDGETDKFENNINSDFPNVINCMKTCGSWDYVLKVVAYNLEHCDGIRNKLAALPNVARTRSYPLFGEKTSPLPILPLNYGASG